LKRLSQWWEKQTLSTKLSQVLLPLVAIGTVLLMIVLNFTLHASFLNSNYDVTGWGSLLIGSAIGTYITIAILIYSNSSQQKTDKMINQMSLILNEQKRIHENRSNYAILRIRAYLPAIKAEVGFIDQAVERLNREQNNEDILKNQIFQMEQNKTNTIKTVEDILTLSDIVDDLMIMEEIKRVCELAKPNGIERREGNTWMHKLFVQQIYRDIDILIERLPNPQS